MLTYKVVTRLLANLIDRPNHLVKTAIYVAKSADIDALGHYIKQFLDDESNISRDAYKFDYSRDDIYIEKNSDYKMLRYISELDYKIIFILAGNEESELFQFVETLPEDNRLIFISIDSKLQAYRLLDQQKQLRQLQKKAS